ncbi:methionyl-tRNA formyltransferase, partial [Patescibacteria group bacterium]|nr:methionyl-tRNA formyltransferase [Patescibacteria group bacterium]
MTNEQMINDKLKIVYFGSDDFSARVLEKLVEENTVQVCSVITKYPTKLGRGLVETCNPVEQVAQKNNIEVINVTSLLKNPSQITHKLFQNIDFAVVVSFGFILPDEILNYLKDKFINLHVSLLPKYRGACPMEQTIINNDKITGSTIM